MPGFRIIIKQNIPSVTNIIHLNIIINIELPHIYRTGQSHWGMDWVTHYRSLWVKKWAHVLVDNDLYYHAKPKSSICLLVSRYCLLVLHDSTDAKRIQLDFINTNNHTTIRVEVLLTSGSHSVTLRAVCPEDRHQSVSSSIHDLSVHAFKSQLDCSPASFHVVRRPVAINDKHTYLVVRA